MRGARIIALCAAVAVLGVPPARMAEAGRAIERYGRLQDRPVDMGAIIEKFERFTMKHGTAIRPPLPTFQRLPGNADSSITVEMIADRLDEAKRKMQRADIAGARADLDEALGWIRENPQTATKVPGLVGLLTRTFVMLALIADDARDKQGAIAWMVHLHAIIPDHPAIRTKYGDDAEKLYLDGLKADARASHGQLVVRVTEPRARIFVEAVERGNKGVFEGTFPVTGAPLRIYVDVDGIGYAFERTLTDGGKAQLVVDWDFHRSFIASTDWIGLVIPPELGARETELLDQAAMEISSTTYILLGLRRTGSQRYLTGAVYTQRSGFGREGEILLDDAQEDARMAAFAEFLETGTTSPLVTVGIGTSTEEQPEVVFVPPLSYSQALPYALGAGAGVGLATGGLLLVLHRRQADQCQDVPCTAIGLSMLAVGAVGVIVSVWLLGRRSRRAEALPVTIVTSRSGVTAGLAWEF